MIELLALLHTDTFTIGMTILEPATIGVNLSPNPPKDVLGDSP